MFRQTSAPAAAVLLLGALAPGQPAAGCGITVTPAQPTVVDEAVLFAFDSVSIAATDNLIRTMHQPEKHPGNPVVPLGARGEPDEWQQRYYVYVGKSD
jgi:hypothetical protein